MRLFPNIVIALISFISVNCVDIVVKTKQGLVSGVEKEATDGQKYVGFLGIPYAKPPVGELRFKAPQPSSPWTEVHNGSVTGSECIQWDEFMHNPPQRIGAEDCLYLNVYTKNTAAKRPVLVYIHGGGFFIGSGNPSSVGPDLLMKRDIVFVAMNYRLGIFGFLSTGNEHIPGNMGLKDQSLALKWIKENIDSFGGDPAKITISGESVGSLSVHYHMLSPMSKGLFTSGISISGTAMCLSAFVPTDIAQTRAKKVAEFLNCPQTLDEEMVQCITKKNAEEIAPLLSKFKEFFMAPLMAMGPTLETQTTEEAFLSETPYDIITSRKIQDVPWINGIMSNEGLVFSLLLAQNEKLMKELNEDSERVFPILLDYKNKTDNPNKVTNSLKKFYFGDKEISKSTGLQFSQLLSDNMFNEGLYKSVALQLAQKQKSPIYVFILTAQSDTAQWKQMINEENMKEFGYNSMEEVGTSHADDIQYMLVNRMTPPMQPNSDNEKVSNNILDIITAFMENGVPHPAWKPTTENLEYFQIDTEVEMRNDFPLCRVKFWSSLPLRTNVKGKLYLENNEINEEIEKCRNEYKSTSVRISLYHNVLFVFPSIVNILYLFYLL